jgi:hypothetical protein
MGFILTAQLLMGCESSSVSIPISTPTPAITITQTPTPPPTPTPIPSPTSTPDTTVDFESFIIELETTMPGAFTEGFLLPSKSDQQAFRTTILFIMDQEIEAATRLASTFNYELVRFSDQVDSDAESYILREQQPIEYGWGLYIFRAQAPREVVIEAPHPVADVKTSTVALHLYRALDAKALLVGGTHRDANIDGSSDPARNQDGIFQIVHSTLFQPGEEPDNKMIFVQIHGYSTARHPDYPEVILGYNWENDPEKDGILAKVVESMQKHKIHVGICDGKKYQGLCGVSNVQRQVTAGGIFLHIELSETIRRDDQALIDAFADAFVP